VTDFFITHYDADEKSQALVLAKQASAINEAKAEGVRKTAKGDADAIDLKSSAEALRFQKMVRGYVDMGVSPDVAAQMVAQVEKATQMRQAGLTTYVEGGSKVLLTVSDSGNQRNDSSTTSEQAKQNPQKGGKK
jgi:hypothetical protein